MILISCVTEPPLNGGNELPDGDSSCSWNVCNSDMSKLTTLCTGHTVPFTTLCTGHAVPRFSTLIFHDVSMTNKMFSCLGFLFAFHSNHGSILYHFRVKTIYWFFVAPLHSAPPSGGSPRREYCHPIWYRKTDVQKTFISLAVSTEYQTDGWTDILPQHRPCYAYASRSKNYEWYSRV